MLAAATTDPRRAALARVLSSLADSDPKARSALHIRKAVKSTVHTKPRPNQRTCASWLAVRSGAARDVRWARWRPSPPPPKHPKATACEQRHRAPSSFFWLRTCTTYRTGTAHVELGLATERTANLLARKPEWLWQCLPRRLRLAALSARHSDRDAASSGVGSPGLPGELL